MNLVYDFKKTEADIYTTIPNVNFEKKNSGLGVNMLLYGENLAAMKWLIESKKLGGSVDLVYIDPPFSTNTDFTVKDGRSQTISRSRDGDLAYADKLKGEFFIEFLRERLFLIKMLLKDTGSIYLHIDYKIGHYVKLIMDEIFGFDNFRNDITRIKCNPKNFARKGYSNVKDLILFYSMSDKMFWNEPKIPYSDDDVSRLYPKIDSDGRRYTTVPLHAPGETINGRSSLPFKGLHPPSGRHWRTDVAIMETWDNEGLIEWSSKGNPRKVIYSDEQNGKRVQDLWSDFKDPQYPEYPTEKNSKMLELIIKTSSPEDALIMDCFAGSGTTLLAASNTGRRWLGIDNSKHAIKCIQKKLGRIEPDFFAKSESYEYYELVSSEYHLDENFVHKDATKISSC